MRQIKIASVPEVGIFWLYRGIIYKRSERVKDLIWDRGTKGVEYFHETKWAEVSLEIEHDHPGFLSKQLKYNHIPRGRIWQDQSENAFVMVTLKDIAHVTHLWQEIFEDFNIHSSLKRRVCYDSLYDFPEGFLK